MACSLTKKVNSPVVLPIIPLALLLTLAVLAGCATIDSAKFGCRESANPGECVSTCGSGCVNAKWAQTYKDPCVNVRAFDCSCVDAVCYTDGRPPK